MNRNVAIALALAAAAAALWLVTSMNVRKERPPASEPSSYATPVGGMQLEEQPKEQPPPVRPAVPSGGAPAAPAPEPSAPAAPSTGRPPPPPAAKLPPPERTGPIDALKARFARDPRDAAASTFEEEITAAFKSDDVPPALLHSVSCRATVCRVETRWAPDRGIGFMSAFTRLLMIAPDDPTPRLFDTNLAISPESAPDAIGVRSVDVYIARLPQTEPAR